MLPLGHAGIALGAVALIDSAVNKRNPLHLGSVQPAQQSSNNKAFQLSKIDLRFLFLGTLLPDIIDKPVGWIFFSQGRVFSHTLIFLLLITLAGYIVYRRSAKNWLLVVSLGVFFHLFMDYMWDSYKIFLWPFWGFGFERMDHGEIIDKILHGLYSDPGLYIPEIIGGLILIWFAAVLLRRRQMRAFIKYGSLN
jgi:membrane-bound metal-dependent hydrolase YbcI (DUF457 family)